MADEKWKRFEKLVYEIQRELTGNADVRIGDSILGADSRANRQLDITIRERVGQYSLLIVLECKDWQTPLDVPEVEGFVTKLRDVRANKGALIASNGFTAAAIQLAIHYGIETFRLIDTENTDWKSYVSIPVLLERSFIKSYRLGLTGSARPGRVVDLETVGAVPVLSSDGEALGTLRGLLARKWNAKEIGFEPGVYEVILAENVVINLNDGSFSIAVASAAVTVQRDYYFGQAPIHVRGFKDEQKGGVLTRTFRTEDLDPSAIEQGNVPGWRRLEAGDTLAVTPTIRFGYSDVLPDEIANEGRGDLRSNR